MHYLHVLALQVGLDALVLRIEVGHIDNQVLKHEHVSQGRNDCRPGKVSVDCLNAGERVHAIAIHGARSADTLTARPNSVINIYSL